MPLSPSDKDRVNHLQQASAFLRQKGAPEQLADSVEFVLSDEGAKFINRLRWQKQADTSPNLPIEMLKSLRDAIKAKAASVHGVSLPAEAEHAVKEFLAGRFTPAQPKKAARGTAGEKANLNVRVNSALREDADQLGKSLLADDELSWAPRTSHVIVSWLTDQLEDGFRNPVRKKYRGRELWTAKQCAEARKISVSEWLTEQLEDSAPKPVWVSPQGPLWDPDDVPPAEGADTGAE